MAHRKVVAPAGVLFPQNGPEFCSVIPVQRLPVVLVEHLHTISHHHGCSVFAFVLRDVIWGIAFLCGEVEEGIEICEKVVSRDRTDGGQGTGRWSDRHRREQWLPDHGSSRFPSEHDFSATISVCQRTIRRSSKRGTYSLRVHASAEITGDSCLTPMSPSIDKSSSTSGQCKP